MWKYGDFGLPVVMDTIRGGDGSNTIVGCSGPTRLTLLSVSWNQVSTTIPFTFLNMQAPAQLMAEFVDKSKAQSSLDVKFEDAKMSQNVRA